LKDPLTVPNANIRVRNFLFLKSYLIALKYSVFSAYEPADTGVGGRYLNHNIARNAGIRDKMNSQRRRAVNSDCILSLESSWITKKGGMRKPAAVPIIFATESIAKATERYLIPYLHF
jgi:hypothetical protein